MTQWSAVVFDMDGVLVDSERIIRSAWVLAARDHGYELPDELFHRVIGSASGTASRIIDEIMGPNFPAGQVFEDAQLRVTESVRDGWPPRAGAPELIDALSELGVPMAVASSTRRSQVEARLESAGLLQSIRAICAGDEVERGKPHPEIFQSAAQRLGIPSTHCVAVEDSMHGVTAAEAAGMFTILVPDQVPAPAPMPTIVHHCAIDMHAAAKVVLEKLTRA